MPLQTLQGTIILNTYKFNTKTNLDFSIIKDPKHYTVKEVASFIIQEKLDLNFFYLALGKKLALNKFRLISLELHKFLLNL